MCASSHAMMHQLKNILKCFFVTEFPKEENQQVGKLCGKLDNLATILNLTPYDRRDKFKGNLLPVFYNAIQRVPTICPNTSICINANCEPHGLLQATMLQDILLVILIKENTIYQDVPVLTGKCTTCDTTSHGDHECFRDKHQM